MAIRVQRDIDNKKNKTKKNIERLKDVANTVMTATRRKKQPTELLNEPIKPGTLLTNARKRTIVNLTNEKPPNETPNQVL